MSDIRRNADRNRAIQAMMTDGEQLKTFYRFVVNNPHIPLHDACQIVISRPSASVCFSFEEWNAQGRRVSFGCLSVFLLQKIFFNTQGFCVLGVYT